jgi:uncharacterized damage-inducible protein DinB
MPMDPCCDAAGPAASPKRGTRRSEGPIDRDLTGPYARGMTTHAELLAALDEEMDALRRVLERIPADRLAVKPHPRSMSVGDLAMHLARIPGWAPSMVEADGYDLAKAQVQPVTAGTTKDDILAQFEANRALARSALAGANEAALAGPWSLRRGEVALATMPRARAVRRFVIDHVIHHRGQLTVHLRLLDAPVPGLYGPSADESFG